jgi:phosphohistidine swiveling domain-containing protein
MTFQEIYADDRSQVELRRETYEGFRNFQAPGEIGARYPFGSECELSAREPSGAWGPRSAEPPASGSGGSPTGSTPGTHSPSTNGNKLVGIAASRGVAHGTARVANSAQEAAQVEPGAILVCPFTDPGWTPVLARVGGVVTETGGLLSHAAVICREFGIPAVLGVPMATARIPDGTRIAVDANQGFVHLMNTNMTGANR